MWYRVHVCCTMTPFPILSIFSKILVPLLFDFMLCNNSSQFVQNGKDYCHNLNCFCSLFWSFLTNTNPVMIMAQKEIMSLNCYILIIIFRHIPCSFCFWLSHHSSLFSSSLHILPPFQCNYNIFLHLIQFIDCHVLDLWSFLCNLDKNNFICIQLHKFISFFSSQRWNTEEGNFVKNLLPQFFHFSLFPNCDAWSIFPT